jgi:hypothetical protein
MMIVIEMILMGIFATYFMDLTGGFFAKRKFIQSFIEPEAVGRWFLYMLKGKFVHKDINKTPALNNEKSWSFVSHYLIGIVLAGIYLILDFKILTTHYRIWMPVIFGIATVILPWFWMLPSMGFGLLASKSPNKLSIIKTNLVNHTNFGLGLLIWIVSFHSFLT